MGTKLNPGKYDCYANAEDDEPMFILLARDKSAPALVNLWANLREGDYRGAVAHFAQLIVHSETEDKLDKIQEAHACAFNMRRWRENRK